MVELLKQKEQLEKDIRVLTVDFERLDGKEKWEVESKILYKKTELNRLRRNNKVKSKAVSAFELILDVNSRPSIPRYETGVKPLDIALNGGIEIGSFVQLAGSSFAGKTHLVIEIMSKVAEYDKVLFFNFEMGDRRIASRFEKSLKSETAKRNMLVHNDNRELSHIVDEILSAAKDGVRFFGIDSKMKIEVSDEKEDYKKFSKISATFSKLTQENEIIIFLINQVSEDDDKNGRMAFKGSGDQLYDTDIALFYKLNKKDINSRVLVCRKNRQDENNFTLNLRLNQYGETVSADNEVPIVYQDKQGGYHAPTSVTEYKDNVDMSVL